MTRILEIAKTNYSTLLKQVHEAGIEAVSEQHWLTLKSITELILNPKFAVFQVHQHIHKLKRQLPDKSAKFNAAPYRELIHWARLIQPNYRKRQAKTIECLNDPLWWHRCVEKVKTLPIAQQESAIGRLNDIQNRWHFQQTYAHYSTLDILHVYQTILPVFTEWLHYAKTEWQQKVNILPPRLKKFYQDYLNWFEEALLEEKTLLRNCLRERLAIGIRKGYGAWDNVIESLRAELEHIGILLKSTKENAWLYGYLTPETFVLINQIIEQEGSEAEKIALYQLTGDYPHAFDKSTTFYHHYRINAEGCRYLIPPARSDMIPTELPLYLKLPHFLEQLFWGDVATYTFFQAPNCQFLLAQNKAQLEVPIDLSHLELEDIFEHPTWKQSDLCLQLCRSELERTASWLKSVWLFFFPAVKPLLQGYQTDVKADAENWAMKQLQMLKGIIKHAEGRQLTETQQNTIQSGILHLKQAHQHWGFSAIFQDQLSEISPSISFADDKKTAITEQPIFIAAPVIPMLPTLPIREAFPIALKQVIEWVKKANNLPADCVAALEIELQTQVNSYLYDSLALRLWLVDYLANTPHLPKSLVAALQSVLDDPKFSEKTLDRAENKALHELSKKSLASSVTQHTIVEPTAKTTSLWDADPWNYLDEEFEDHCHWLKQLTNLSPHTLSVAENERLCRYTLQFLKYIQNLTHWDDFVLKRDRVEILLEILTKLSEVHFSVLAPSLSAIAMAEKNLCEKKWSEFTRKTLQLRIDILEAFIHPNSLTLTQPQNRSDEKHEQKAALFPLPTSLKIY